ncbi:MAG: tetratricopeptide repeat protein [Deltaproteobacteria bacterium]|nr:tetratricopeptide repeat protein [Deltaproteobacteria bacterium]
MQAIIKRVEPSVVLVVAYDGEGRVLGQAGGFFINREGDVITNRRALTGASRAGIKTSGGEFFSVKRVVAEDMEGDIIRISTLPGNTVTPLNLSASLPADKEPVMVVGGSPGADRMVGESVISAVREIPLFGNIIQISGEIFPGYSGSPVVNMKGEAVGVALFQRVDEESLNFAVPSERITRLLNGKGKTFAEWKSESGAGDPTSKEGLYFSGLIHLWAGDYEKAFPYFEKAARKSPGYADACFQKGYCNQGLGRFKEAVGDYMDAIRINPGDENAYYYLGWTYAGLGRYGEAISSFKEALRAKPRDARAHLSMGLVHLSHGDRDSASNEYMILKTIDGDMAKKLYDMIHKAD